MPKTNPFEAFAASSSSKRPAVNSGWFNTKKRGRDDAQIARDKQKAMEAKRSRLSKGGSKSTIANKSKTKAKAKAKTSSRRGKIDDDESDDSFIASDESEVEYDESEAEDDFIEESEEEDDDIIIEEDDEEESHNGDDHDTDHDSIVEIDSSPEKKRKDFKPTRVARTKKEKVERAKPKPLQKKKMSAKVPTITLDSSEDEENDELEIAPPQAKLSARKPNSKNTNASNGKAFKKYDLSELDSSDDDSPVKMKTKTKKKQQQTTSKFFAKVSSPPLHQTKKRTKKRQTFFDSSDDESEGEGKKNEHAPTRTSPPRKSSSTTRISINSGLSDTDDDEALEALALSKALEDSKREEEERQKKSLKGYKKTESKVIYKEDPESDENEDDGDVEEAEDYVDEKELEASNVLDAANNLSARIVLAMMKWFSNKNDNLNGDGNDVPKGMIIDGAIALSSVNMQTKSSGTSQEEKKQDADDVQCNDRWITKEEMQRVCPKLILKDYQLIGVNWLALLHSETFVMGSDESEKKRRKGGNGRNVNGVLADEMGLGKTAQTIAFLAWLRYHKTGGPPDDSDCDESVDDEDHQPHIIIVPASVLENWLREFKKFCPTMNVMKYHGSMAERQEIKSELRQYLPKKKAQDKGKTSRFVKKLDVVLTTFSYFSSEKSDDRSFLRKFDWNYMVVDEAHCLKNPKGQRYKNMDAFNTERRLLLTGTPVQNSPKELMSLLCFLMPLFSREASSFDEDNKNDGGARMLEYFVRLEATDKRTNKAVSQEESYRKLKHLLAPFVLRRCKDEVLGQWLPAKKRHVEWVPFDEATRNVYDSLVAKHLQSKGDPFSQSSTNNIFTSLRKAANHALLLRTRHTSPSAVEHLSKHLRQFGYFGNDATCTQTLVKRELEKFSDYDIHCAAAALIDENSLRKSELDRYTLNEEHLYCSPKFVRLKTMIPQLIGEKHRMLIFSQWTRCLDLLGCLLDTMDIRYLRLDGQTDIKERQTLIDQYTNDETIPIFLLSTRAGGMGINLTAADTCILHDLDFNPFNDLQAEDRVHRIGQKKLVTVIKMVTENTVDSDIYKMQERKAKMNAAILETKLSSSAAKKKEKDEANGIIEMAISRYNSEKTSNK